MQSDDWAGIKTDSPKQFNISPQCILLMGWGLVQPADRHEGALLSFYTKT